jgi:hypothetical protein
MKNEFVYLSPQAKEKLLSSPLLQIASPEFKERLDRILEPLALELRYTYNWQDLFKLAFKTSAYVGSLSIEQRPLNPGSGNYWDIIRALDRIPLTPELKEDLFVEAVQSWRGFVKRILELSGAPLASPQGVLTEVAREVDWDALTEARSIHMHVADQPFLPEEQLLQAYQKLETMLSKNFLPIPWNHIVIGEYESREGKRKKIILFPVQARKEVSGTGSKVTIDLPKDFLNMGWEYLGTALDLVENPRPSEGVNATQGTLYILGAVEADVEPIPVSRDQPLFGVSLSLGQGEIFSTLPKDLGTTFQRASHGWCGGALLSEDGLAGMILFASRPLTAFPSYIPNEVLAYYIKEALKDKLGRVRNAPLLGIQ